MQRAFLQILDCKPHLKHFTGLKLNYFVILCCIMIVMLYNVSITWKTERWKIINLHKYAKYSLFVVSKYQTIYRTSMKHNWSLSNVGYFLRILLSVLNQRMFISKHCLLLFLIFLPDAACRTHEVYSFINDSNEWLDVRGDVVSRVRAETGYQRCHCVTVL